MRRCLSLGLSLAFAGLLSGCYSVGPPPLYAPGYQYSSPRYVPPQYDDPRNAEPTPAPYDTRAPEPFSPSMLEPATPSAPSPPDDDAAAPAGPGAQPQPPDMSEAPAPARRPARTAAPAGSVPLMGFRPMRGQQGL